MGGMTTTLSPVLAEALRTSWARSWSGLSAQGDGAALMHRLVSAYQEPQRRYHTTEHLGECLALLAQHLDLAQSPAEVEMAMWFHDAVYDVTASDNEARSAGWARAALTEAGVLPARAERVGQHIMATLHSALPKPGDQTLLVDVDLSILGAPRARFKAYEEQVRAEYGWVPEPVFRQKRAEVLSGFLGRPAIFGTPKIHALLESSARANLAWSIQRLAG
jgi:predicted metal-dependent HD superfamily phosphohydrolase